MINASAALQDQAYDSIKEKILNDEFSPDEMYSETKLAKDLSISRTPLRNALRGLEQDGYIVIAPSRGFMIRSLDHQGMQESIEIRSAIEGYCVYRTAADEMNDRKKKLISSLEEILSKMEKTVNDPSKVKDFIKFDHDFHQQIIEYVGNRFQLAEIQRIYYLMRQTSRKALRKEGRIKTTHDEHVNIYQAIKNGDGNLAYKTMLEHLSEPLKIILD